MRFDWIIEVNILAVRDVMIEQTGVRKHNNFNHALTKGDTALKHCREYPYLKSYFSLLQTVLNFSSSKDTSLLKTL
jgi:hypothetical protein